METKSEIIKFHTKVKVLDNSYVDLHIRYLKRYNLDLPTYLIRHYGIDYYEIDYFFDSKYDHITLFGILKEKADNIIQKALNIEQQTNKLN